MEYHHIDRITYLYIYQAMDYISEQDFLIPKNKFFFQIKQNLNKLEIHFEDLFHLLLLN
jgi:hypothetical protein